MQWVSIVAVSFVVWWVVLFAMLPIGMRTQDEEGSITLGTSESAPAVPWMLRTILRTTLVTIVVVTIFFGVTRGLGYSFDDFPSMVPDFTRAFD